jgi:hypothetical protein
MNITYVTHEGVMGEVVLPVVDLVGERGQAAKLLAVGLRPRLCTRRGCTRRELLLCAVNRRR